MTKPKKIYEAREADGKRISAWRAPDDAWFYYQDHGGRLRRMSKEEATVWGVTIVERETAPIGMLYGTGGASDDEDR